MINPVINIFDAILGRECLSVNYGFCSFTNESLSNELIIEQIKKFNTKVLVELLVYGKKNNFRYNFYAVGQCLDCSYVEKKHQDHMKKILGVPPLTLSVGGNKIIDQYSWAIDDKIMDSSIVYRLFPKQFITLPKKDTFSVDIDPIDLLHIKSETKETTNSKVKRKAEQVKQKKAKRINELREEINYFLNVVNDLLNKQEDSILISSYRLDFAVYKLNEYEELASNFNFKSLVDKIEVQLSKTKEYIKFQKERKKKTNLIKAENKNKDKVEEVIKEKGCPKCGLMISIDSIFCLRCGHYFND